MTVIDIFTASRHIKSYIIEDPNELSKQRNATRMSVFPSQQEQVCPISLDQIGKANAGSITYPAHGTYGTRRQNCWQLVLLHSGSVRIQVDDDIIQLDPGEVCLLEPGHMEFFQFDHKGPSWHRWISLFPCNPEISCTGTLTGLPVRIRIPPALNAMVDAMLQLHLAGVPDEHASMRYLGLSALTCFLRAAVYQTDRVLGHPALDRILTYIRQNYTRPVTLADMAEIAGLSREYLIRLCRQKSGTTPLQLLWRYRLERALDLLQNSGLAFADIAERCGFTSYQHFSRRIHRETGQTPTQIRRASMLG